MTPLALYLCFYLATFWAGVSAHIPWSQWIGLASACCATVATIWLWHQGRWDIGLRTSPGNALRELAGGAFIGVLVIGAAGALIVLFSPLRQVPGHGFPFVETVTIFLPAVLHEELVFRGYPYQLVRRRSRIVAIVASSLLFAALHAGNSDVTTLALVNIFLGGIVLALAYERHRRLWMPIGLHFAWNMVSGPILGYDVSGFPPAASLLVTIVTGPAVLTGGGFGIEGSVLMTGVEAVAAVVLWRMKNSEFRISH